MTQKPKYHKVPCIQEERIKDIEEDVEDLDEKQEGTNVLMAGILTELKYLKLLLGAIFTLAGIVAIELFKLL